MHLHGCLHPCSQLRLTVSGMMGTSTMTGLLLVSPRLMEPNCKQLLVDSVKLRTSGLETFTSSMSIPILRMPSACLRMHPITPDNPRPLPPAMYLCPGSSHIPTTTSIFTTSPLVSNYLITN